MTTENPEEPRRPESDAAEADAQAAAEAEPEAAPEAAAAPQAEPEPEPAAESEPESEPDDEQQDEYEEEEDEDEDEEPEEDTRGRRRRGGPQVATGIAGGGYRGSLPPRKDRLAAPWVILVSVIFVLILVLSAFGLPSKLFTPARPRSRPSTRRAPLSRHRRARSSHR